MFCVKLIKTLHHKAFWVCFRPSSVFTWFCERFYAVKSMGGFIATRKNAVLFGRWQRSIGGGGVDGLGRTAPYPPPLTPSGGSRWGHTQPTQPYLCNHPLQNQRDPRMCFKTLKQSKINSPSRMRRTLLIVCLCR